MTFVIAVDDPEADDVRALVERHLAFAREVTPPAGVHALPVDRLVDPGVTFFSARGDGALLGVAALERLDGTHVEIKSMHVAEAARRRGVARALLAHPLAVAADRGYRRVSLETGTTDAFAPARALYERAGFRPCPAFGAYLSSPTSACMTLELGAAEA